MITELTEHQIQENKDTFIFLINSIDRPNTDKEGLINKLCGSDFFEAPASAIYHNSFKGGLCAHSLNVYYTLVGLCKTMFKEGECPYSDDSLKIVALLHDFDKMNKYEKFVRNQKVYSETGSKFDEMGKFDWVAVPGWKRKEDKDIFILGTHGENSVYMTETFVPLSPEEHCAILNHHSVYDNPKLDTTGIYSRYHLACLLHLADMASTYVIES